MSELADIRQQLFASSLELGSIQLDMSFPFRWASGYMMPIYNDSRLLLSSPAARNLIARSLELLLQQSDCLHVQNVVGVATGGIAHALLLAQQLALPMQYVRSSAKAHGLSRKIEGLPRSSYDKATAVVIEDVISTGDSALQAVQAVRQAGAQVLGCYVLYSYMFPEAEQAFRQADLSYQAVLSFPQLLSYVEERKLFRSEEIRQLRQWHTQPFIKKAES